MIKDMAYYRMFDLLAASKAIALLGTDRGNHEVFGDAIQSLLIAAAEREVKGDEIEQILGMPDRVRKNEWGQVLEYDWSEPYGPITYTSSTPFQIVNGLCIGLSRDE